MKRSDFLKAFSGLIATPLLITNLASSTPNPSDNVVKLDLNETITTDTFDFVDYIIQRSGGKINGHQLYKVPKPGFLVNPDGSPYVYVDGDTLMRDMKVVRTRQLRTHLDGDFFYKNKRYTSTELTDNENFVNVMRENVTERRIVADKLIKEFGGMIDKPTYLYTILATPMMHRYNPDTDNIREDASFHVMYVRMA